MFKSYQSAEMTNVLCVLHAFFDWANIFFTRFSIGLQKCYTIFFSGLNQGRRSTPKKLDGVPASKLEDSENKGNAVLFWGKEGDHEGDHEG